MSRSFDRDQLFSITELAEQLDLTPRAIRFYEAKGLLVPRRVANTRVYTHRDHARLQIIQRGKRLGFTLAGIQEYLDLYDADPTHQEQLQLLLRGVRERMRQLEDQRCDLELTMDELREIEEQTLRAMGTAEADSGDASAAAPGSPDDSTADGGAIEP